MLNSTFDTSADLPALAVLDAEGFLMAPGETELSYLERIRAFSVRMREFNDDLERREGRTIDGLVLTRDKMVAAAALAVCADRTESVYSFRAEWVPSFYINPSFSWLFGGCAYYSMPDMFAVVILRRSFAGQQKWLFYNRNEILAHEMCHAARLAVGSRVYEERLAYKISDSVFRRRFGGLLHSPFDTLAILGSTFMLLAAQMTRTFAVPTLPIWPFWLLVVMVISFMLVRDLGCHRIMSCAIRNMSKVSDFPDAVIFRCSDTEIAKIAELSDVSELHAWLRHVCLSERRWQVIIHRFIPSIRLDE